MHRPVLEVNRNWQGQRRKTIAEQSVTATSQLLASQSGDFVTEQDPAFQPNIYRGEDYGHFIDNPLTMPAARHAWPSDMTLCAEGESRPRRCIRSKRLRLKLMEQPIVRMFWVRRTNLSFPVLHMWKIDNPL